MKRRESITIYRSDLKDPTKDIDEIEAIDALTEREINLASRIIFVDNDKSISILKYIPAFVQEDELIQKYFESQRRWDDIS